MNTNNSENICNKNNILSKYSKASLYSNIENKKFDNKLIIEINELKIKYR